MDDAHIGAVIHGGVLDLEVTDGHLNGPDSHVVVFGGVGIAAHQVCPGVDLTLGILDVGAGHQNVTGDGVQGKTGLIGQDALSLGENGVDGQKIHLVGDGHIVSVLLDGGGDGRHGQLLAVGGHTFGQLSGGLCQGRELAELDGLAAVPGDRPLLAELVMHQKGLCQVDEAVVVVGFHLHRKLGGDVGVGVSVKPGQVGGPDPVQNIVGVHSSPFCGARGTHWNVILSPRSARRANSSRSLAVSLLGSEE